MTRDPPRSKDSKRPDPKPDRLALDPEEMRALGYQVIDRLVSAWTDVEPRPFPEPGEPAILRERIPGIPERGRPFPQLLDLLEGEVFSRSMRLDHPRFFAFVPSPNNFISVLAEALTAGFNPFAGNWFEASGPAEVERSTLDWLRRELGLADGAGGIFVSGGSAANLTALCAARTLKLGEAIGSGVVYCSDQAHSCIARACRILGLRRDQLRVLESDAAFRLDPGGLEEAIAEDRRRGLRPFCLVASAGTTNTGAIDPLPALAAIAAREGLWFHVDGAYGAATALTPAGKALLAGIERADSVALDPHKWLFQPYEMGALLVRDAADLPRTFKARAEYFDLIDGCGAEAIHYCDYGIQLTRSFRALKLWLSLQFFGAARFRAAIERGLRLAEDAAEQAADDPRWERVTGPRLGVVNLRLRLPGLDERQIDRLQTRASRALLRSGLALITTTRLRGRPVLRLCTINPRTRSVDIARSLRGLIEAGERLVREGELD